MEHSFTSFRVDASSSEVIFEIFGLLIKIFNKYIILLDKHNSVIKGENFVKYLVTIIKFFQVFEVIALKLIEFAPINNA